MCKTRLFKTVLRLVSQETEISEIMILSKSRCTAVVDARSILVNILNDYGVYPVEIASFIKQTPASIRKIISNFDFRARNNKLIDTITQDIRNRLKNNIMELL